jgi:hypothetical protein
VNLWLTWAVAVLPRGSEQWTVVCRGEFAYRSHRTVGVPAAHHPGIWWRAVLGE